MTDRARARVYHGLRNLPPNVLPSDILDQSRFFNALHDAESCSSGRSTLTSPGFEAYLARKAREPPPTKHRESKSSSSNLQDSRTNAFLSMYGIDPSDIQCNVKKDPYITDEQARLLSFKYNPDRDTTVLPASDLDAVAYNFLTPESIKQEVPVENLEAFEFSCDDLSTLHQYATILEVNNSLLDASEVKTELPSIETSTVVSEDSGIQSLECSSDYKCKIARPPVVRLVQLKIWYTGRPVVMRHKCFVRLGVKVRRVHHIGRGSHSLVGSRTCVHSDIKYGGKRLIHKK